MGISDLAIKIINFIIECLKAFINIFSFGKLFKKEDKKIEDKQDGMQS